MPVKLLSPNRFVVAAAALLLAGWLVFAPARQAAEQGPLVLAAASMQEALDEAADNWAARGHPRPVLSFAGTQALARQLLAGAPADLFVSADREWMDRLEQRALLAPGSRADLAGNALVLIAPIGSAPKLARLTPAALTQALGEGRLALADPAAVPAGRYGRQSLETLGLWSAAEARLAPSESVRAALALVARGAAPLGLVYASDALAEPGVVILQRLPGASHAPIVYPLARLAGSTHADAEGFRNFLLSPEAQAILRRHGFEPAP